MLNLCRSLLSYLLLHSGHEVLRNFFQKEQAMVTFFFFFFLFFFYKRHLKSAYVQKPCPLPTPYTHTHSYVQKIQVLDTRGLPF